MEMEKDGTIIIEGGEVNVRYRFVGNDEIFCTVIEQIKSYQMDYKFYTHYKSLKH